MKGYKAFNSDLTCRGFQYEIGKEYTFDGEPIPCRQGFHFCKSIAECYEFYDMRDNTRICEVEALGEVATDDNIKYCTNKICIVAEVTEEWERKGNTDASSTGYRNSGYRNSGYGNSGDGNSGDWNSGNNSSGVFCTDKSPKIKLFDKESDMTMNEWVESKAYRVMCECPCTCSDFVSSEDMTDEEKEAHPEHETTGGFVKVFVATAEDKQKWWDNLYDDDKEAVMSLPNFDADKFKECTEIEVRSKEREE